jgi:hypothetical protein
VCALQNARRQAYSAATPDGRSTETDSSCAAASSSPVFASPADGSPQVSYMLHTLRPPPTPNNATVVIFELPLPPTNCRVSDYKSGEHCRFHAPVEVRAALVCFGVSIRRPCFRSQVCFQASAGRCSRFQTRQPVQALCSVVLTFTSRCLQNEQSQPSIHTLFLYQGLWYAWPSTAIVATLI